MWGHEIYFPDTPGRNGDFPEPGDRLSDPFGRNLNAQAAPEFCSRADRHADGRGRHAVCDDLEHTGAGFHLVGQNELERAVRVCGEEGARPQY